MTNEEIAALIAELRGSGWARADKFANALASLQAELAALRHNYEYQRERGEDFEARSASLQAERDELSDELNAQQTINTLHGEVLSEWKARAENAEARLASIPTCDDLIEALARAENAEALVERAFREGLAYATHVHIRNKTNEDVAWETSEARAALKED